MELNISESIVVKKFQDRVGLYQDEELVTLTQKNEELELQEDMAITSLKNFQDSDWLSQDEVNVFDGLLEQKLELRSDMFWDYYWWVFKTRWKINVVVGWLIFRHFNLGKQNLAWAENLVWEATHRLLFGLRYWWWKFRRKLLHAQALSLNHVAEVFLVEVSSRDDLKKATFIGAFGKRRSL